jgi:hypothetical protein
MKKKTREIKNALVKRRKSIGLNLTKISLMKIAWVTLKAEK